MTDDASRLGLEPGSIPTWWQPGGPRCDDSGYGVLENGYLRQSAKEARRWAKDRGLTPSQLRLTDDECRRIATYSDGAAHRQINEDFYEDRKLPDNDILEAALRKGVIPEGVIVWRGAGYRLYHYPISGPTISDNDLTQAIGGEYRHKAPMSTSVGNGAAEIGLGQEVYYRLEIEPGVRGVFIPEIAMKGYAEQELLLAPGARVRIVQAERCSGKWYVRATVLAQG
jgi:hypothetical protein